MALSEFALSEEPISSDLVFAWTGGLDYWLVLNGTFETATALESINIEDTQGGNSTARFTLYNPNSFPRAGQAVAIVWQDQTLFGGQLVTVTLDLDQAEAVRVFACEAVGWMRVLERRIINAELTNTTFPEVANYAIATILSSEGIIPNVLDVGPDLLLAKGENIRVSEFIRDTAEASGGIAYIDPYKRLQFRRTTIDSAPFLLTNNDIEFTQSEEDLDQYRNTEHVLVTGTGGASVSVSRQDDAEIANRITFEGGSGIYEVYDRIDHPISNDPIELERLGISYAVTKLAATARVRRSFRAKIRRPELRLGQIVSVDLPGFQLAGEWQIVRLRTWDEGTELVFEFEAQLTNFQQLALESLLQIVGAGRATVVLPLADFGTTDTITTLGASTYTVSGTGNVELEITVYGAGAGGQAGFKRLYGAPITIGPATPGINGGNGGKAVTFITVPASSTLSLFVGSLGTGGIWAPDFGGAYGTDGGLTSVTYGGMVIAQGDGGLATGAHGGALGDHAFTGDGAGGGIGGPFGSNGASGNHGWIEIRY